MNEHNNQSFLKQNDAQETTNHTPDSFKDFLQKMRLSFTALPKQYKISIAVLLIVIVALVIIVFSVNSSPSHNTTADFTQGLEYSLNADGKGYSVIGIGSCTDALVVIPEKYNGKLVVAINERAFQDCEIIENVILPNSIITIGERAFQNCRSLKSITLGTSVTNIGWYAFGWCTSLQSISFSDSVINIEQNAFCSCKSLKTINYEGTKTQWNSINKEFAWNNYTSTITVACKDGKLYE